MDVRRLGKVIQDTRLAAGLSLEDLSRISEVSSSYIWGLEKGKHPRPGTGKLRAIATALGYSSLDALLAASKPDHPRQEKTLGGGLSAIPRSASPFTPEEEQRLRELFREEFRAVFGEGWERKQPPDDDGNNHNDSEPERRRRTS